MMSISNCSPHITVSPPEAYLAQMWASYVSRKMISWLIQTATEMRVPNLKAVGRAMRA